MHRNLDRNRLENGEIGIGNSGNGFCPLRQRRSHTQVERETYISRIRTLCILLMDAIISNDRIGSNALVLGNAITVLANLFNAIRYFLDEKIMR